MFLTQCAAKCDTHQSGEHSFGLRGTNRSETKVADERYLFVGQQEVLQFEVSVTNVELVLVFQFGHEYFEAHISLS